MKLGEGYTGILLHYRTLMFNISELSVNHMNLNLGIGHFFYIRIHLESLIKTAAIQHKNERKKQTTSLSHQIT